MQVEYGDDIINYGHIELGRELVIGLPTENGYKELSFAMDNGTYAVTGWDDYNSNVQSEGLCILPQNRPSQDDIHEEEYYLEADVPPTGDGIWLSFESADWFGEHISGPSGVNVPTGLSGHLTYVLHLKKMWYGNVVELNINTYKGYYNGNAQPLE